MKYFVQIALMLLAFQQSLYCITIGSNTTSSRQLRSFFPASDSNNAILGFTVCEKGITLEDASTVCSFDAFFPLLGDLVLSGGTLSLQRDLVLKSPFRIGSGTILGNGYSIEFPRNLSTLSLPSLNHNRKLDLLDSITLAIYSFSVDWSYDDKYLAVSTYRSAAENEIQIYSFLNNNLTLVASQDLPTSALWQIRWHPSSYYFATSSSTGSELQTWVFDDVEESISMVDSLETKPVYSLAWSPTGDHIAIAFGYTTTMKIYPVSDGTLGSEILAEFDTNVYVQRNALDWDSTGNYIAAGCNLHATHPELYVFSFDGNSATLDASVELGSYIFTLAWHPSKPLLAVGNYLGVERLRLYEHSPGSLVEKTSARVGQLKPIYVVDWSHDGTYLAAGKYRDTTGHEIEIFSFDPKEITFNLVTGYEFGTSSYGVLTCRWANNKNLLASGSYFQNKINVYNLAEDKLIFDNVRLFFGSDVILNGPVYFAGDCVFSTAGNVLDMSSSSSILITSGGTLCIEDTVIKGVTGESICCADDTARLILRDSTWQQDSNITFSTGSIQFESENKIKGDGVFAYQSAQTSTLGIRSELILDPGITFSYDPIRIDSKTLLECASDSSQITLNGATLYITTTGLELTKGKMEVYRDSRLETEKKLLDDGNVYDVGLSLGDGLPGNDFACQILSGAELQLASGSLHYKNLLGSSWKALSDRSILRIKSGAALNLYQSLDMGEGVMRFEDSTILARALGKKAVGSVNVDGSISFKNL